MPQLGLGLGIQKEQNNGGGTPTPPVWTDDYSFQFNGIDQYIGCPHDPVMNITTNLTISAWCKPTVQDPTTGDGFVLDKYTTNNGYALSQDDFGTGVNGGRWAFILGDGASVTRIRTTSATHPIAGVWQHVAATFDSVTGDGIIYMDGVPITTANLGAGTTLGTNGVDFAMGHSDTVLPPTGMYLGKLDELSVFNITMTPAQIIELYNGGTPADLAVHSGAANGVLWYRMGEGAVFGGTNWVMPNAFNPGSNDATSDARSITDRTVDVP